MNQKRDDASCGSIRPIAALVVLAIFAVLAVHDCDSCRWLTDPCSKIPVSTPNCARAK